MKHAQIKDKFLERLGAIIASTILLMRVVTQSEDANGKPHVEYGVISGAEQLQMMGFSIDAMEVVPPHNDASMMAGNMFSALSVAPLWMAFVLARPLIAS